jgi:60 kDa SS-A/Ro ribonucleoprotein
MNYSKYYNTKRTSQKQAIPGKDQVKNDAGGYVFAISNWDRLDRFLVLGSEGGTYYVGEQKLTVENAENVRDCIREDGIRTVSRIVEISRDGRAPKNDPALFALALCVAFGDKETRAAALYSLNQVARIGTHLFQFVHFVTSMSKWNRSLRTAISNWYNGRSASAVAYQILKYQSRTVEQGNPLSSWSHKDVLRLAHPKPLSDLHSDVFKWAIYGWDSPEEHSELEVAQVWAYEMAKRYDNEKDIVSLIKDYRLTREMIPTKWLKSLAVWEALLEKMPMTAMVRNLGKMTSIGLLKPMSDASRLVAEKLTNQEYVKKSRLHPLSILVTMATYAQGCGMRGNLSWSPVTSVVDALDDAFYLSFGNIKPTGKRTMLCLDLSGSMGAAISGTPISARAASAAMALVTKAVERDCMITGFTMQGKDAVSFPGQSAEGLPLGVSELPISSRERLDDVVGKIENIWGCGGWGRKYRFTGTDCSLPMRYALKKKIPVDAFVVYTDSQTWASPDMHPCQALDLYRNKMGIDAKIVVVGMTANKFSIADKDDVRSLNVVGFDTATPQIISDFIKD